MTVKYLNDPRCMQNKCIIKAILLLFFDFVSFKTKYLIQKGKMSIFYIISKQKYQDNKNEFIFLWCNIFSSSKTNKSHKTIFFFDITQQHTVKDKPFFLPYENLVIEEREQGEEENKPNMWN